MFTDAEKTDIRRFCGYPAYGQAGTSAEGYRFMTSYGALEYRLNNLSAAEESVVRTTYLANLPTLETDIFGARANLDTAAASVWTHNPREQADREALFASWRLKLCGFLGVPAGPELQGTGTMRMVV